MQYVVKTIKYFYNDSLFKNSIYLMVSSFIMAFFGFFFWILSARFYTPEQVGLATSLISVISLISTFSLLGLNNGIIRYLPSSDNKSLKINTSFTIVAVTSLLLALIYLIFINVFSPKLVFIRDQIPFSLLFIAFVVFLALNTISENVFIAYRSSIYIVIKNIIYSIAKLILPILFVSLGAFGIFASVGFSIIFAFILSFIFLVIKFGYDFKPVINTKIVKHMFRFSLGNYIAGFIGSLPTMVLPIIILNKLGAQFSAYFYMDMMIANFLYMIPMAVSQSLFAEGSFDEARITIQLKKAVEIISLILLPAVIVCLLFGKYILLSFGQEYANEGFGLLQILTISTIFVSINYIFNSILYIKHKLKLTILINFINMTTILLLSSTLTNGNLSSIGFAWIIGQGVTSLIYLLFFRYLF